MDNVVEEFFMEGKLCVGLHRSYSHGDREPMTIGKSGVLCSLPVG